MALNVLIVTSRFMPESFILACTLQSALENLQRNAHITLLDFSDEFPTKISGLLARISGYFEQVAPNFYRRIEGFSYRASLHYQAKVLGRCLRRIPTTLLKNTMKERHPDCVIFTVPALSYLEYLTNKCPFRIPCYAVIAHHSVHPIWNDSGFRSYFLNSHQAKNSASLQGMDASKVVITGLPSSAHLATEWNEPYGSLPVIRPDTPRNNITFLLHPHIGDALNFEALNTLQKTLSHYPLNFVMMVRRNTYYKKLSQLFLNNAHVQLFPDASTLETLIGQSQLVITPACPTLTARMLIRSTPFLLYGSNRGVLRSNIDYYVQHGMSLYACEIFELIKNIQFVLSDPYQARQFMHNMHIYRPKKAAIVAMMEGMFGPTAVSEIHSTPFIVCEAASSRL